MKIEYYIDKIKAVDVFRLKPLEAYKQLRGIIFEYFDDTEDYSLLSFCNAYECIAIPEALPDILEEDGWKTVWDFLRHIPEESINDDYFMMENYRLRPIATGDAVKLQKKVLDVLQKKLMSPEQKLIQELRDLGDITPYNRQFYEMQTLVQEYARDTGNTGINDYLKRYTGYPGVRKKIEAILDNRESSRDAVREIDTLLSGIDCEAEVFSAAPFLKDATTEGLEALRDEIIAYLLNKEKKTNDVK